MTAFLTKRQVAHRMVSAELTALSDQQLMERLHKAEALSVGIGGNKRLLRVDGKAIFVKEVPITDLELHEENYRSTKNLFDLPLYYQYGLSSAGFGAWRELAAQEMASSWVLEGSCPSFPLLYHWRVLKRAEPPSESHEILKEVERSVKYWGGSKAIRSRLLAKHTAPADLVLFIEYLPETLDKWLGLELHQAEAQIEKACEWLPEALFEVTQFMSARGLVHFDAHLNNILTDGSSLYFADFGLALSSSFALSEQEQKFFQLHANFDRSLVVLSLVHRVLAAHLGTKDRNKVIEAYAEGKGEALSSPALTRLVKTYAPTAALMRKFIDQLLFEDKSTVYPADLLDKLFV